MEAIYDAQIAPLMTQIINICFMNGIPMLASFQLSVGDDPLYCSTVLPGRDASEWMSCMQLTITRGVEVQE